MSSSRQINTKPYHPVPSSPVELPASPTSSTITLSMDPPTYHPTKLLPFAHSLARFLPTPPSLRNLLFNFTLGFADGLTVPFALTAGLSSLGQTKTVISAGLVEICAESISMGIGGYLAARNPEAGETKRGEEGKEQLLSADAEKGDKGGEQELMRYLEVLKLPRELERQVVELVGMNG